MNEEIILKTPENWIEVLRDIDWSFFDKFHSFYGQPELQARLENPDYDNGLLLKYRNLNVERMADKKEHCVVQLELLRRQKVAWMGNVGDWIINYDQLSFPLPIPQFVQIESRGIKGLNKVVESFFPSLIKEGYKIWEGVGIVISANDKYILGINSDKTSIDTNPRGFKGNWISKQNVGRLIEKYGKLEKVEV